MITSLNESLVTKASSYQCANGFPFVQKRVHALNEILDAALKQLGNMPDREFGTLEKRYRVHHALLLQNMHKLESDPKLSLLKLIRFVGIGWRCITFEAKIPDIQEPTVVKIVRLPYFNRAYDTRFDLPIHEDWQGTIDGIKNNHNKYGYFAQPFADTASVTKQDKERLKEYILSIHGKNGLPAYKLKSDFMHRNQMGWYNGSLYLVD